MYTLLKNNIIEFEKLLIEKYSALNLDEIDTIILIKLNSLLKQGKRLLSVDDISSTMKISNNECGKRIVDMVNNGFITLELSSVDAKEIFSLDETYKRLAYLLENMKKNNKENNVNMKIKNTVKLLEDELKKILTPLELEMVSRWYIEYNYSDEKIEEAIMKALKYKNRGIPYIDRALRVCQSQEFDKAIGQTETIQDLFNRIYVKKNG